MKKIAKIGNKYSVSRYWLESDPSKEIYGFIVYGVLYYSGDLENIRGSKAEAYTDIGVDVKELKRKASAERK